MITVEEAKKRNLENIKKGIELWSNDERGKDNPNVSRQLSYFDMLYKNIDEVTRIQLISSIREATCLGNKLPQSLIMKDLSLSEDDKLVNRVKNESLASAEAMSDYIVQEIYEDLGYTDKIPTKLELLKLNREYQMSLEERDENPVRLIETEKAYEVAKLSAGYGIFDAGFPTQLPSKLIEVYDKRIEEAKINMVPNGKGKSHK